jgi:vitamin B12 transporter
MMRLNFTSTRSAPRRRAAAVPLACLAVAAAQVAAAGPATSVPLVVISAATFAQPLSQALPSVSVITRAQIEQSGIHNVTTLLERVGGVQVTANGGPGQPATTYLQGFGGTDAGVLVLLNGVPITPQDASGGGDYLENLTTDQIERIEVIRGNVSAIYGSGAIGGVILITTRSGGRRPRASLALSGGSRNTATASANASGEIGHTLVQAGVSRYTTEGIPSINPAESTSVTDNVPDGYHNLTANASIVQQLGAHERLGVQGFVSDGRYTFDNHSAGGRTTEDLVQIFSDNRITNIWTSQLSLSRQRTDNIDVGSYPSAYYSSTVDFLWRNVVRLSKHWTLTGGATRQRQSVSSSAVSGIPSSARYVTAEFAGVNGNVDGNELQLNVRHDQVDGYRGTHNTVFAAYGRDLGAGFKAIASYATAFNAPSLGYLYYNSPYWAANPLLQPETAHTVEAALQWSHAAAVARVTLFQTTGNGLWGYGTTPDGLTQFQNIARTRTRGVELSGRGAWHRLSWEANLTLQQPLALSEPGQPTLQRLARSLADVTLQYDFGSLTAGLEMHYSGPRPDVTYSPSFTTIPVTLGSYTTVALTLSGPIGRRVRWNVRAQNLFDKHYETAYSYNSLPFGLFAGLTWQPFGR